MKKIASASLFAALTYFFIAPAWADPVLRAVTVETDDVAGYLEELSKGKALMAELDAVGEIRVFQATFAGPQTGTIVVTVQWPDIATMVADEAKLSQSEEYGDWVADLDDIRDIVSDSLYTEL